jgi:nucleotide-binding universal stress UspA family protein
MNHNRILVALSLTDGRDGAFERALTLAKVSDAELFLLHAVPSNQPYSFGAAERLQRAAYLHRRAEAAGVRAQTFEQHGDPAEIIVLHADAHLVDLVVMGTERRTGWARFRQRSVAERVLRRTKRPTLVVGNDVTGNRSAFENVLVAVDLSSASTALIDTAMQLSGGDARQVTAIHAFYSMEAAGASVGETYRRLEALTPPSIGTDVRMQLRVAGGPAAETIAAHAANVDADLIVIGRSKRLMHLGPTAAHLMRNTDRAVLIVPLPPAAQTIDAEQSIHTRAA